MYKCPNGHNPKEVIAEVPEVFDPDRIGVLLYADSGMATNRWTDGTVGVSLDILRLAEEDESPLCPMCKEICKWE